MVADLKGKRFAEAPNRTIVFGRITDEIAFLMGREGGEIRLHYGYPGAKGYGLLHVTGYESRMKQIEGMGFPSFQAFAYSVCQNYNVVGEGDNGRFLLVHKAGGYDCYVVIQRDEGHWSITTGLPARVARFRREIWKGTRTDGSEPASNAVGKRTRLATLSLPGSKASSDDKGS